MFSRFKADRGGSSSGVGSGGMGCAGGNTGGGGGGSSPSATLLEGNAITTFFEIGRQTATAGPGYLWKVHDAYRKSDGKVRRNTFTFIQILLILYTSVRICDDMTSLLKIYACGLWGATDGW